jgi:hypothetical protein
VGDACFQQKCFERVLGFKKRGGSLLIASHSTYHIVRLCDRAVWLHDGEIAVEGSPHEVVSRYEDYLRKKGGVKEKKEKEVSELPPLFVKDVRVVPSVVKHGDPVDVYIRLVSQEETVGEVHLAFGIARNDGLQIFVTSTQLDGLSPVVIDGEREVVFKVASLPLLSGEYHPVATILDANGLAPLHRMDGGPFHVEKREVEMGVCFIEHKWEIR